MLFCGYLENPLVPRDILELRSKKTGTIHMENLLFGENNSVLRTSSRKSASLSAIPEDGSANAPDIATGSRHISYRVLPPQAEETAQCPTCFNG